MTDKKQIHIQVLESTKDEWDEAVSESAEYKTLSSLIRTSVARELAGTHDKSAEIDDKEMRQIRIRLEGLDRIEREIDAIKDCIMDVKQQVQTDPELTDLASDIFQILPDKGDLRLKDPIVYRDGELQYWVPQNVFGETDLTASLDEIADQGLANTGRIEAFAHILDKDPFTVKMAVEKLYQDTATVRRTDDGRYYRRSD